MLRVRRKHFNSLVYMAFLICMSLIVSVFLGRVITGSDVTEMSVGQVIRISRDYEFGEVIDRKGNVIVSGNGSKAVWSSEEMKAAYEPILGLDIAETAGVETTILGNCPWVFGAEDNRLTWDGLIHPGKKKTGGSVRLTLDSELQEYVSGLIAEKGYENAYVFVSNYETGEILAVYGDVFHDSLHPGSTIKPILAAAALSLDPGFADHTYHCIPGNHNFQTKDGPVRIHCANRASHGMVNMSDALAYSCNGYFISLMQQVDREDMENALGKWGFDTVVTHNQFMYWDHSFVKESSQETDYLLAAIGQANAYITPAGLNFCTNALLNHGKLAEPVWFAAKKRTPDSEWQGVERKPQASVCTCEAAEQVVSMMERVTEEGTGRAFYLPGFAAKTGTAQKADKTGKLTGEATVWTTGGLTDEATPYSVTVCLDHVTGSTPSTEAGVVAQSILRYMTEGGD